MYCGRAGGEARPDPVWLSVMGPHLSDVIDRERAIEVLAERGRVDMIAVLQC